MLRAGTTPNVDQTEPRLLTWCVSASLHRSAAFRRLRRGTPASVRTPTERTCARNGYGTVALPGHLDPAPNISGCPGGTRYSNRCAGTTHAANLGICFVERSPPRVVANDSASDIWAPHRYERFASLPLRGRSNAWFGYRPEQQRATFRQLFRVGTRTTQTPRASTCLRHGRQTRDKVSGGPRCRCYQPGILWLLGSFSFCRALNRRRCRQVICIQTTELSQSAAPFSVSVPAVAQIPRKDATKRCRTRWNDRRSGVRWARLLNRQTAAHSSIGRTTRRGYEQNRQSLDPGYCYRCRFDCRSCAWNGCTAAQVLTRLLNTPNACCVGFLLMPCRTLKLANKPLRLVRYDTRYCLRNDATCQTPRAVTRQNR